VTVRAGETVEWKNTDATMWHSVTADPERVAKPSNVALPAGATPFH
jgi:plastocyanin